MTDYVVLGLTKRRAWIAGEIERKHAEIRQLILDLEAIDGTLAQFDPGYNLETIKPKAFRHPKDWSRRGEMTRVVLAIMRQAAEPMTTRDIALELLVTRALDKNDQKLLRLMSKRVAVALTGQAEPGNRPFLPGAGAVQSLGNRAVGAPPGPKSRPPLADFFAPPVPAPLPLGIWADFHPSARRRRCARSLLLAMA